MNIKTLKTDKSRFSKNTKFDFGRVFSDHILECKFENGQWQEPIIKPYGPIEMYPASSVLHYCQSVFEGMKAYRNSEKEVINLFRPDENYKRLKKSCIRTSMPTPPEEVFIEGIKQLVSLDQQWVPYKPGTSLYIRPFVFACENFIGVRPSTEYLFYIITCPVESYYSKNLDVKIETEFARAMKGGTGNTKMGGNYSMALFPDEEVKKQGFDQVIWTDAYEHKYIEEIGTMNVAFQIGDEIITPKPSGTILDGITKKSVMEIARDLGIKVSERPVLISEVVEAYKSEQLDDAFGIGTAAVISHINSITYRDKKMDISQSQRNMSNRLKKELLDLQYGYKPDTKGWIIPV